MKIQNKIRIASLVLTFLVILSLPFSIYAAPPSSGRIQEEIDTAIAGGFDYFFEQINEDGGLPWIDESSSVATTIRVVQALTAAGLSQNFLISGSGNRPIDFLSAQGIDWVNQTETDSPGFNPARAGQLLSAIAAANLDPHNFGSSNSDLIFELKAQYNQKTGIYGKADADNVIDQVWTMIGLAAANASVAEAAADWLASVQAEDGSWNDGYGSFLDTTPLAIMALIGSTYYDIDSPSIQSALNFLKLNQQDDGGWQTEWDTTTNPNTTGVILQVISNLGQFPTDENWQKGEGNPLTALLALQGEDGVFGGESGNVYSTADAIIGLTGQNITSLGFLQASSKAVDFLIDQQKSDGGWGNVGQTLDVMLALNAAGWLPDTVIVEGQSPLDFIIDNFPAYIEAGPDTIGKTILGITAAGLNPRDFNGVDLGQNLLDTFDETSRAFGSAENTWHQAFAILGLIAVDSEIPQGAVDTLVNLQMEDGGWEYSLGFGTTPDSTSLAIQALIAAGYSEQDQVVIKAMDYLHSTQKNDGGWGDSSTTSFTIMVFNALGQTSDLWTAESGKTPLSNLVSFQKANGAFIYSWEFPDDSIMSTASSLLALLGGDYILQESSLPQENYAAIVIDPGNGATQTACVSLGSQSINGFDLLELSALEYEVDQDGFVSSIVNVSNLEGETNYWSYWFWDGREWQFQNTGAANTVVLPGTIEAWYFTSWDQFPSPPSEFIPDINQICGEVILTDFSQQPNLEFNDLVPFERHGIVENETPSEESTEQKIEESSEFLTPEEGEFVPAIDTPLPDQLPDEQAATASPLGIIVIAIVGIVLILITTFYMRKHK